MRMWMVPTDFLCDKHLLGEHFEIHLFVSAIKSGRSIQGYLNKGLLNVADLSRRHRQIVREMKRRGMNHRSPLCVDFCAVVKNTVDIDVSWRELARRCPDCRRRRT